MSQQLSSLLEKREYAEIDKGIFISFWSNQNYLWMRMPVRVGHDWATELNWCLSGSAQILKPEE